MTSEELEFLVLQSKTTRELQEVFAPLDAGQRKKLSTSADKLFTQISRNKANKTASERLKRFITARPEDRWNQWNGNASRNAALALYALCPISTVKKRDLYVGWENREVLCQIILDRRPDWLDEWVEHNLEQEFSVIDFPMLRRWIENDACGKPSTDGYFTLFATHMTLTSRPDEPPRPPISKQLLGSPDLLDDVWGLFRVENTAFDNAYWITQRAPEDYETWPDALLKLSESGQLDRQALLDVTLEGLSQGIKQTQLSGFHKFHKRLKPNKSERAQREEEYLLLLSHKVGHVCKFGLEMLSQIEKDGNLNSESFLSEVQTVFSQEGKGNAVAALKLIQRILKNQSDISEPALRSTIEALQHSNADVQELAIEILESNKTTLDDALRETVNRFSSFVSASTKGKLLALLGQQEVPQEPGHPFDSLGIEDLEAAIARFTPDEKRALRIDEMMASETFCYLPISDNILDHRILPTVEAISPIGCVDELIEVVSHAAEIVETPDVIERIIDGVSRLCNEKPDDFSEKSAPLLHRLEQGGSEASKGIVGYGGTGLALTDLLVTWLTARLHETPARQYFRATDSLEPLVSHMRSIGRRAVSGIPAPLLSAPTHTGGWIDPLVWVRRLQAAEKNRHKFEPLDCCLSLLRLTPDNRLVALAEAKNLSSELKLPAIFALGGDTKPSLADRKHYDLWISAARSRDPAADWSELLVPLKVIDPWPDSSQPAKYRWRAYHTKTPPSYGKSYVIPRFDIGLGTDNKPASTRKSSKLIDKVVKAVSSQFKTDWRKMPSAALNQRTENQHHWPEDLNTTWVVQWQPYQWPLCASAAYMTGVWMLTRRIDEDSSHWNPGFGHLNALFQKNRPWLVPGHLLLCLGFVGRDADSKGLAIDAMIEGVESGQFDPKVFAKCLSGLSKSGWLKLNRLGDNFMQVVQTSPLHAWVVSDCIQHWLLDTDIKQRNLSQVLEVLLEAQSELGQSLRKDVCELLKSLKGSSKAAKVAAKLQHLGDTNPDSANVLKHLAITVRVGIA